MKFLPDLNWPGGIHLKPRYTRHWPDQTGVRTVLCLRLLWVCHHFFYSLVSINVHSKTPNVVTVLSLDSDDVVTILSSTRNLLEGYKTVYLCHLDSYTVTVCNGYLVSSPVVMEQFPTRCLVDRYLHRPHGSGYLIMCVSDVVTVRPTCFLDPGPECPPN